MYAKLQAIKALQDTIDNWEGYTKASMATTDLTRRTSSKQRHQYPRVTTATPGTPTDPRVKAPPRVQPISTNDIPANHHPIAQRMRPQLDPNKLEPATVIEQPVAHSTRYLTTQQ